MFTVPRSALLFLVLSLVPSVTGCGYYSTSAAGGTRLKSIAVPLFKNETLEHGLEETVTRAIVDAFVADNHLAVVAEPEAESILWGVLADYRRVPFSFNAQGVVVEYKLEIIARVEYQDKAHEKTLWSQNDLNAWATYLSDGEASAAPEGSESTAASEEEARGLAVEKLARELVAKTTGGW